MSDRTELEAAVEAVLFVSSEPVPRSRLLEMFDEEDREAAARAVEEVLARYAAAADRGVQVEEVAGGVRLITRPEMNGWLRRFFEVTGSNKLSMAALETLAIIAYRQPMTGPEIQELRGVNPSGVLKTLLDRHLIRIAGRKEVVGRPFLYCTTREFLVHFGLKSLKDLPPLEEFEDAFDESSGEGEPPPEPGLGTPPGGDREEAILRTAAELEEHEGERPDGEADGPADDDSDGGVATAPHGEAGAKAGTATGAESGTDVDEGRSDDPADGRDDHEAAAKPAGEAAEPGKETR